MTELSLAARNFLAQDERVTSLLGRSASWDTWIFSEVPYAKIENTQRCLVVISEGPPWTDMNPHNRLYFPTLRVDIWADPTRNPSDNSVRIEDAKDKAIEVMRAIDWSMHLVDPGRPSDGMPYMWGTAEQISQKTGIVVTGSFKDSGPEFSPIKDSPGSWMARVVYAVNQL